MAALQDHFRQWTHNRELLAAIDHTHPDWLVTIAFYVSLHAVDALLVNDHVRGINCHDARNKVLLDTNRYLAIRRAYMPLYDLSRTVRYLAKPERWVPFDQIDANVIRRYLYPIERSVQNLLGMDLKLPNVVLKPGPNSDRTC